MISIPEELLDQFDRENVIPLVGESVNRGVLPLAEDLAEELAQRSNYPPDESRMLHRVAGFYELTTRNRPSMIDFLRDRLDNPDVKPALSHRLIAQLRTELVVTVCYDRLLEYAYREEGIPFLPVISNEDIAYSDERKSMLVWLWGVIDRPESLVITEDDHYRFLQDRENLSYVLRGEMSRRTWLFLGFDHEDAWFRSYYDSVTRRLDHHRRRSYVVRKKMSEYTRAWWSNRADIIETDVESFLLELTNQLAARRQHQVQQEDAPVVIGAAAETASIPLPERPYKLLDFYEAKDAPIFFGREAETYKLSALIHAHRLVLLYSASGAGKTSLLLAGVFPRLKGSDSDYEIIYSRILDNPAEVIRQAVKRRLPDVDLPEGGPLLDFLSAATRSVDKTIVIILDQFEEFFMRFNPAMRSEFIVKLGAIYDARDVPVKIVLSLREDWLASVNEIRERIPEVFNIDMRLLPLTREQAYQAITGPAKKLGVSYAPQLVDQLLQDLMEEADEAKNSSVKTPQLQLVCDAVYEHARLNNRKNITVADYESVGGAQGILERYIETALRKHRGDEREMAQNILIALVTSHDTKSRQDLESLASELGIDEAQVAQVLARLVGQRLVRRIDEENTYELAHDILAATISTWFDEDERNKKEVQELLRRELADWRQDPNALLSEGKYRRIFALRDRLRFTDEEAAYMLRAAVLYNEDAPYWLERVNDPHTQIEILLEMLGSEYLQARLTAVHLLARYPQDRVALALAHRALDDAELQVRDMAAAALGQQGGQAGIDFLTIVAGDKSSPQRPRAILALARIRDVAPNQKIEVSGSNRFRIFINLAGIRYKRDWTKIRRVTIAGAFGGALGFGLGLFIPMANQFTQVLRSGSLLDLFFIIPVMALFGMLAGAILAFGISGMESLKRERPALARVFGGILFGGLGFAFALSFFALVDSDGISDTLLNIAGGGLFGVLIALGMTLPAVFTANKVAAIVGGTLGGSVGIVVWGLFGFEPLQVQTLPLPALLASGGLTGFVLSFFVVMAYSRSASEAENSENDRVHIDHLQAIEGTPL
ncbi:MAG: SIR2 family protein [Candidatus Promineifilaceae bacterium]